MYKINLNCYIMYKILLQAYVLFEVLLYSVIADNSSFFILHCLKVMLVEKILCFYEVENPLGKKAFL